MLGVRLKRTTTYVKTRTQLTGWITTVTRLTTIRIERIGYLKGLRGYNLKEVTRWTIIGVVREYSS